MNAHKGIFASIAAVALMGSSAPASQDNSGPEKALALMQKRMPKTDISEIKCDQPFGLCELRAGDNIFYVDEEAKHLFIGHIYDLETKQDLTDARLKSLKGVIAGAGAGGGIAATASANNSAKVERISLRGLSSKGAVKWGSASGPKVSVFSDFRCPYCRAVAHELEKLGANVTEYPISLLGSRAVSETVICSENKAKAAKEAYAGVPVRSPSCDTSGLDENEAFARKNGLMETPILVRSDGVVLRGYRSADILSKWLEAAQ